MNKYNNFLKKKDKNFNYIVRIIHNTIYTEDIDIYCLPCVLFDPVWILHDNKVNSKYSKLNNFDNFFKTTDEDISNFFDNQCYSYHWHSRNNYKIEKKSFFERLENKFLL